MATLEMVVKRAVEKALGPRIEEIVRERLETPGVVLRPWVFHRLVAVEMMRTDPRMSRPRAEREAKIVIDDVRRETGRWGNPDYAWDAAAAREAAHVFAIDHWDATP